MRQIRKVLILDDVAQAAATRELLKNAGAASVIDIANNSRQAISYIEQQEFKFPEQMPDLVLLEINLPNNSGLDFVSGFMDLSPEIREKIYLVVLTQIEDEDILKKIYENPDIEYVIRKPLTEKNIRDLQIRVEENLKK